MESEGCELDLYLDEKVFNIFKDFMAKWAQFLLHSVSVSRLYGEDIWRLTKMIIGNNYLDAFVGETSHLVECYLSWITCSLDLDLWSSSCPESENLVSNTTDDQCIL